MTVHRCILCDEMTATEPDYPCRDCCAADLMQEEETAAALLDREEYLRTHNLDELSAEERADLEKRLSDIA